MTKSTDKKTTERTIRSKKRSKDVVIACKKRALIFVTIAFLFGLLSSCDRSEKSVPSKPNILFCIADDASWQHFGAYGCDWVKTPGFDQVAKSGILFKNAYTPNAKCAPSRSCIITGLNSWQLKAAANHVPFFPQEFHSYIEVLKENGFLVGTTGKGWAPGKALDKDGNNRELTGKFYNEIKLTAPTKFISNIDYAENFKRFLKEKKDGQPFCFWYGGKEPHRFYEYGSGANKGGKHINEIEEVPAFWPDADTVRNDMLDYAFEIEHFDTHLERMLNHLKEIGELENTIVIVTADNGMPFPRVKGQVYEYSNHLPLAIMWPKGIKNPGRKVEDYISFIDFAPTLLELSGIDLSKSKMQKMEGRSLTEIFYSGKDGQVIAERDFILVGKERHDLGRPGDAGYPVRGILKNNMLYLYNYHVERWPAGNPETGYLNCDGGATKSYILNQRRIFGKMKYWQLNFGKRIKEELYNVKDDPYCMNNLIYNPEYAHEVAFLKAGMKEKLSIQKDPRMFENGEIFMTYPYAEDNRGMYDKLMAGEDVNTGWVYDTDFEPEWVNK